MLFQIPLLNRLAQMPLGGIAIGRQRSDCLGNGYPATLPGDGQHLFSSGANFSSNLFINYPYSWKMNPVSPLGTKPLMS